MRIRVSVIVPLYNKAPYLERALGSIARQTCAAFEIIVVDDGSSDGGGELAARYPDPRVRLVTQDNAGPGAARNRGIAEARCPVLAFLDADDEWLPGCLETNLALLDRHHAAAVTSCYRDHPGPLSREDLWRRRGIREGLQRLSPAMPATLLSYMVNYMSPCSTMARTEVVRRWGGFHSAAGCRFGEDGILWLKVLLNEPVYFHLRPLAEFHREASGLTGGWRRFRPAEPILLDSASVTRSCPEELRPLLRRLLAVRACKAASVLGYWGRTAEARALFREFLSMRDWRLPYFPTALLACTPTAAMAGRLIRGLLDATQGRRA